MKRWERHNINAPKQRSLSEQALRLYTMAVLEQIGQADHAGDPVDALMDIEKKVSLFDLYMDKCAWLTEEV